MDQQAHAKFKFKAITHPGQTIKLVGSHKLLGNWDPLLAIELSTEPSSYPFWSTPFIILPQNAEIEYKYMFCEDVGSAWETLPNRKITITQPNVIIEDIDKDPVSKVFYSPTDFEDDEEIFDETKSFNEKDSVLILTYFLPITAKMNKEGQWEFELTKGVWQSQLFMMLNEKNVDFLWAGLCDVYPEDEEQQETLTALMKSKFRCIPIFIEPKLLQSHEKFCSLVLYKLLHNIIELSGKTLLEQSDDLWTAYKRVNILFSDAILAHYSNQIIWVHGPQLFLVPSFISRKTKEIMNIGFFLHHPFPSSEIYRVFPYREAILHAMCCCDLIGFHLFEYARNFFSCCKRVLGLDIELTKGGYLGINYYGRHIMVKSEHIGIQPEMIEKICCEDEYLTAFSRLMEKYHGKKVLLSIDAPSPLAGIALKLRAYKEARKSYRENVVFLQVLVPQVLTYESSAVLEEIKALKEEINSDAEEEVLELIESELTNAERYAYMSISSGLVISSLKDALCLQPFEYLVIKKDSPHGIVLSEFTGVSTALSSPRKVNPFNSQDLEGAIIDLINKPITPQQMHMVQRDIAYVYSRTVHEWMQRFLSDLKRAHKDTANLLYMVHGLGDKLKLIALKKNFRKLNKRKVLEAYNNSSNRMFFFDNEGTLSNFMKQTEIDRKVGPSSRILRALSQLCDDENNTVYVITGRPKEVVNNWFKNLRNLGMAAEYGALMKFYDSNSWKGFYKTQSNWKETAKEIISGYAERTEGSVLMEKDTSVVFLYREADNEFGSYQAKELVSHLDFLLHPFMDEIEISEGLGYVEVKPRGINKGTALYRAMEHAFENKGPIDFIMAIGDDNSDEEMFKMVRLLKKHNSRILLQNRIPTFTCTLGIKPSVASYFLLDAAKVVNLLEHINGESKKAKRNFSYDDVRSKEFENSVNLKLKKYQLDSMPNESDDE